MTNTKPFLSITDVTSKYTQTMHVFMIPKINLQRSFYMCICNKQFDKVKKLFKFLTIKKTSINRVNLKLIKQKDCLPS
jgi:hypothetical protein